MIRFNNLPQMPHLVEQDAKKNEKVNYHIFTCQFMVQLIGEGVEGVSRWIDKIKKRGVQLLDMDLLLFPIVDNGHYSLIVVAHPGLAMMVIENENATGNTNWPG